MNDIQLGLIIGGIFILLSIFFLILTLLNLYFNEKGINWYSTKGKILVSTLTKKTNEYQVDTDIYNSSTETTYKQNIKFEYQFEETYYTSDKIYYLNFNNWFLTDKFKKELAQIYSKNKSVTVYLNPDKKNKAFLIEKSPIDTLLLISTILFLVGLFFLLNN